MTAHSDPAGESAQAIASWLLTALDPALHDTARTQWRNGQTVLVPCGHLFSAVRLPQELVLAHTGGQGDLAAADQIVAQVFDGGPVVCDPCRPARWYVLVPAPTSVWRWHTESWREAGVVALGLGRYLSIPPINATSHDPRSGEPYWAVPPSLPGDVCAPEHVDRLISTTPHRLAREQS